MLLGSRVKAKRLLDFDIENRPLAYLGDDFTTSEITAIAWQFIGEPEQTCVLLGRETKRQMLERFVSAYDAADTVVGHFIRAHDLPIINGELMEQGMAPLAPKMTHDTKLDMVKRKGISASQENLSRMLGLPAEKAHMSNADWRLANRLLPEGLALTEVRVRSDVTQNIQMRAEMLKRGMLGPPRIWRP